MPICRAGSQGSSSGSSMPASSASASAQEFPDQRPRGATAAAGTGACKGFVPPLCVSGLRGSRSDENCQAPVIGRGNMLEAVAQVSESDTGDYSDDGFEDNASPGHSSRECGADEKNLFDRALEAVHAKRHCMDGAAVRQGGPNGVKGLRELNGSDPKLPQQPAAGFSEESLKSSRSRKSNLGSGQREPRFAVAPPPGSGQAMAQPVADVSYGRGASAPALGIKSPYLLDDVQSERSEGVPPDGTGPMEEEDDEPPGEVVPMAYPAYSWQETLARFPSLLRLYPLAECNEPAMEDEFFPSGGEVGAGCNTDLPPDVPSGPDAEAVEWKEGSPQEQPATGPELSAPMAGLMLEREAGCNATQFPQTLGPETEQSVETPEEVHATWHQGVDAGAYMPPPCTPVRIGAARAQATPRSTPSRIPGKTRQMRPHDCPGDWHSGNSTGEGWSRAGLAAAWDEVNQFRRELAQREREVVQREAAVRRAEARNLASTRELKELRRRLDDYGEELEEGVAALTAQQSTLREERRQTLELQARARRMCAAAVRDDLVSSKFHEWDRRSWTPTPSTGGM